MRVGSALLHDKEELLVGFADGLGPFVGPAHVGHDVAAVVDFADAEEAAVGGHQIHELSGRCATAGAVGKDDVGALHGTDEPLDGLHGDEASGGGAAKLLKDRGRDGVGGIDSAIGLAEELRAVIQAHGCPDVVVGIVTHARGRHFLVIGAVGRVKVGDVGPYLVHQIEHIPALRPVKVVVGGKVRDF